MSKSKTAKIPCGKHKYPSEISAKIALMKIQKKDSSKRVSSEERAYPCRPCGAWHLAGRSGWRNDKAMNPKTTQTRLSPDEIDEKVASLLEIDPKMPIMSMVNKLKNVKKHEVKSSLKRIRRTDLS